MAIKPITSRMMLQLIIGVLPLCGIVGLMRFLLSAHQQRNRANSEWRNYAGDKGSSKYSPLDRVNRTNFSNLEVIWKWRSAEEDITSKQPLIKTWPWEWTPLMVEGVLYVRTSLSQAAALDAATGHRLWVYDPETWKHGSPPDHGFVNRGVTYWESSRDRRGDGPGDWDALCDVQHIPICHIAYTQAGAACEVCGRLHLNG